MAQQDKVILMNSIKDILSTSVTEAQMNNIMGKVSATLNSYDIVYHQDEVSTNSNEWIESFLSSKEVESRSVKTIKQYRYRLNRFLKEVNVPFNLVNVYHIREYFAKLKSKGNCENTIKGIYFILSSFFGWCQNEGLITMNPCANIGNIKVPKVIRKPFTQVDLELMRSNCKTIRDKAIIYFLQSTGCRISEACSVNIEDVDFTNMQLSVKGKGAKERMVYLDAVSVMILKQYLSTRTDSYPALFIGKGTQRMGKGGIEKMLHQLEDITSVENIDLHRFRRTLATNLIDRGMSIQDVAKILGHENINTTMKYIYQSDTAVKSSYLKYTA